MAVDAGAGAGAGTGAEDDAPSNKRRAYDNVSGKVSGRPWKASFGRASAAAARPPSDWERKMREKQEKKAIQARQRRAARAAGGSRRLTRRALGGCAGARRWREAGGEGQGGSGEETAC